MYSNSIAERLWSNVIVGEPDECWPYIRAGKSGYGQILWREIEASTYAHRLAYQLTKGEIPDGYVVDHECHNRDSNCLGGGCKHRRCCNPNHLLAKTTSDNVKAAATSRRGTKTHCPHGHEFTSENTLTFGNGYRQCRSCARRRANRWYANKTK